MDINSVDYDRLILPIEQQMIRSVWRILRNSDDADDVFQDALTIVWKKWDHVKKHPNPKALILRICINAAYDKLRRHSREEIFCNINGSATILNDDRNGPIDDLLEKEQRAVIFQAINKLPGGQRLAVHMRFVENMDYVEIAQAMGCRDVTVRKHVSRGIRKLKYSLKDYMAGQTT